MNHKILLVVLVLLVISFVARSVVGQTDQAPSPDMSFQPTALQQEEFQLTLGPGTIFADADFKAHQGKLLSFVVSSTMAGTVNFTDQTGVVISRPIAITPNNQFYVSSDKVGEYDITFEVTKADGTTGTYVLGTLTIQDVQ